MLKKMQFHLKPFEEQNTCSEQKTSCLHVRSFEGSITSRCQGMELMRQHGGEDFFSKQQLNSGFSQCNSDVILNENSPIQFNSQFIISPKLLILVMSKKIQFSFVPSFISNLSANHFVFACHYIRNPLFPRYFTQVFKLC